MIKENFVYFPSFSVGDLAKGFKNDDKMDGGLPIRFYSDEFPAAYRHPYFLVTAGHFYKKMDYKSQYGFDKYPDVTLLGDSGGYQIATGALKWKDSLLPDILNWLEENSNVAMNLDIPPFSEKGFQSCLEHSIKNYQYFEKHRKGQTVMLNVLHGFDETSFDNWYSRTKDFDFQGWGIGSMTSIYKIMSAIKTLMEGKEQYIKRNKWFHFLGISKVYHFLILAQLQKSLHDIGCGVKISTDSSTPSRSIVFGDYYTYPVYHTGKWKVTHVPKEKNFDENEDTRRKTKHTSHQLTGAKEFKLPRTIPFDDLLESQYTYQDLLEYNVNAANAMVMHNFMLFKDVMDDCYRHVNLHPYMLELIIGSDQFLLLKGIDEIVKAYENDTTPQKVFDKYRPHFLKMSSTQSLKHEVKTISHNFFKFNK